MKNKLYKMFIVLLLMLQVWGIYLLLPSSAVTQAQTKVLILLFTGGVTAGVLIMTFFLDKSESSLKMYKRELEKEFIAGTESSSQIKVLESKIEVLEKALKQALDGNK